MPKIVVKHKSEILKEYILLKPVVTIGSASANDVVLEDPLVSTQHCEIRQESNRSIVTDLKSAYGTLLNGQAIRRQELAWEDQIVLGRYELIFRAHNGDAPDLAQPLAPRYFLLGISGPCCGRKFELKKGETRIGRDQEYNDIVIGGGLDPSVSRRHATISLAEGRYILSDKRSRNRTFVNQHQVSETESITLTENDEILIGRNIFRFVPEGSHYYAPPRRAGIFWIRHKPRIMAGLGWLLFLTAAAALYTGFYGIFILRAKPADGLSLAAVSWNPEIVKEDSQPAPLESYDVTSTPALGDVNGDGHPDVVAVNSYGRVYAWDGREGNFLWESPPSVGGRILSSVCLADFNKDGGQDIVVTSDDSRIIVLDGVSGKLIAKSPILGGDLTSCAVADLDQDGQLDVVAGSGDGSLFFFYAPAGSAQVESLAAGDPILGGPSVFSTDKETLVAAGTIKGKLLIVNGATRELESIDTTESINQFLGLHIPINEIASTPVVRDLTKDGVPEIVVLSKQSLVAVFDSKSRDLQWVHHEEKQTSSADLSQEIPPSHTASPVLADFDKDGHPDVCAALPSGQIAAWKGTNGNLFWQQSIAKPYRLVSSPALADLTKDGVPEVLVGTESGQLLVLDGRVGKGKLSQEERVLLKEKGAITAITSSPVVGDLTGDGMTDVFVSSIADDYKLFSSSSPRFKRQLLWPSAGHDAQRSGYLSLEMDWISYGGSALGGAVVVTLLLFWQHRQTKKSLASRPRTIRVK